MTMLSQDTSKKLADSLGAANDLDAAGYFDLEGHLHRQRRFSEATFGPGARVDGVTDHIAKELVEVRESGGALAEWIDVIILAFDGAWRSGAQPREIINAIVAKQTKNEGRSWPDWRTAPAGKAIEHDRSAEASATTSTSAARDVLAERKRQVEVLGWTIQHDDQHDSGELAGAGAAYALHAADALHPQSQGDAYRDGSIPHGWCWADAWWKPAAPRHSLVKAAALILAEIERLDRAAG